MTERDLMMLAAGLVAGYLVGRAHAKALATQTATAQAAADPLDWLRAWQTAGA